MKRLMDYLPENYQDSPETVTVEEAIEPEINTLWDARNSLLEQLDPRTSTWGLIYWEQALGISVDLTKPLAVRRTRVISKIRGAGTTTVERIKNVCASFISGRVEVKEHYAEYWVEITFPDTYGTPPPPYLQDLRDTLKEIMPAHLGWGIRFFQRTHAELGRYTHGQLRKFTHEHIRGGDLTNA